MIRKWNFSVSLLAVAVATGVNVSAQAQDASQNSDATEGTPVLETVVVTGGRSSPQIPVTAKTDYDVDSVEIT